MPHGAWPNHRTRWSRRRSDGPASASPSPPTTSGFAGPTPTSDPCCTTPSASWSARSPGDLDQPVLEGDADGVMAATDRELGVDVAEVGLDRLGADAQALGCAAGRSTTMPRPWAAARRTAWRAVESEHPPITISDVSPVTAAKPCVA